LDQDALVEWQKHYTNGLALEDQGAVREALIAYSNALAVDPEFAEVQFRLGTCHLALTNPTRARLAFELARDHDGLVVRADSRINSIIREAAENHAEDRVRFLDVSTLLGGPPDAGVPGREHFYEHVHLTFQGNYELARLLADEISELLPSQATRDPGESWVDQAQCERLLAATLWDQHRVWMEIHKRLQGPPYTSQSSHATSLEYSRARKQGVIDRIHDDTPQVDRELYVQAVSRAPDDILLLTQYARYLEAMGARDEAIRACRRVCELVPDLEWPHYTLGDLYVRAGNYEQAAASFQRALKVRSDFTEAREALDRLRFHLP
jgi:tetratricopeptide (TPR) repeat protein